MLIRYLELQLLLTFIMLLPSCVSLAPSRNDIRRVCVLAGNSTNSSINHIRSAFGADEYETAKSILRDPAATECWGSAALVVGVSGQAEALDTLARAVDAMASLDRDQIDSHSSGELMLAVGHFAAGLPTEGAKAAVVDFLMKRIDQGWWLSKLGTKPAAKSSATGRTLIALSALGMAGSTAGTAALQRIAADESLRTSLDGAAIADRAALAARQSAARVRLLRDGPAVTRESAGE